MSRLIEAGLKPVSMSVFACLFFLLACFALLSPRAAAQDYSSYLKNNFYSYSAQMRGGGQTIPLLSLPDSLERSSSVLNRSIGGIGGSSFQTESATPEQTLRQVRRATAVPVFGAPLPAEPLFRTVELESGIPERLSEQGSFEQHFGGTSLELDESFRFYAPKLDRSFRTLGGRRKRGLLRDIFYSPDLSR